MVIGRDTRSAEVRARSSCRKSICAIARRLIAMMAMMMAWEVVRHDTRAAYALACSHDVFASRARMTYPLRTRSHLAGEKHLRCRRYL